MTTTMIVGDTHGDSQFMFNLLRSARQLGVQTLVQLGDFGYNFDYALIDLIRSWLQEDEDRQFLWLDGNHDHHDWLTEMMANHSYSAPVDMGSMTFDWVSFPERMLYCPRGSVYQIGSKKCLFLGGAHSIDGPDSEYLPLHHRRRPGIEWWPGETITEADVNRACDNAGDKVDIMFTHDAPSTTWLEESLAGKGYKTDRWSAANRKRVQLVMDNCHPDHLYHGHFHQRYDTLYRSQRWTTEVHGVGANVDSFGYLHHSAIQHNNFLVEEL